MWMGDALIRNVTEVASEVGDTNGVTSNGVKWRAFVNTVMNLWVS